LQSSSDRSDGTRTRDLRRDRPAFRSPARSPLVGVVLLENGLRSVGEDVGGVVLWRKKPPNQAVFRARERRDRTQEVAGSSPASSMRNSRKSAVFLLGRAPGNIHALGPPDGLRWPQMPWKRERRGAASRRGLRQIVGGTLGLTRTRGPLSSRSGGSHGPVQDRRAGSCRRGDRRAVEGRRGSSQAICGRDGSPSS
jgi:hypothetical protein